MKDDKKNYNNHNKNNKNKPGYINSSIEISKNIFQSQGDKNKANAYFNYFQAYGSHIIFDSNDTSIQKLYKELKFKCKYVICIIIEDDESTSGTFLDNTLKGIKNNIIYLKDISIEPDNILICIFFKKIKNNEIFNEDDISSIKSNDQFILVKKNYAIDDDMLDIHCFSKLNYCSDVEILKCFYCIIINQLRTENTIIFTSIITAGVVPESNSLTRLIELSYNRQYNHNIVIPIIEEENLYSLNFVYDTKRYERIHFNIYNMNYYDMTNSIPISSLFNTMTIDDSLFNYLNNYYNNNYINLNATIDFHDYNLSLYLHKNYCNIIYYNYEKMGEINNKSYYSYEYSQIISEYRNIWVKRYSGYYGNFFEIIRSFIDCNNLNIFKRIFMFFQIFGYIVEFIFPSFSSIVIYTIFYEAFNIYDERPAVLCTLIYLTLLISSGACSLVTMNSTKIQFTNLIFYFFFEIYYLFILLCSIVAMDNVRKNKNKTNTNSPYQFKNLDFYQFNTKAIICIIIFTVIPGILPMIFKYETIFDNIIPLILYLLLGASPSSSSFYMAKILNACETCGGKNIPERKGITILIYILSNLFFGSLMFFHDTRKKKS